MSAARQYPTGSTDRPRKGKAAKAAPSLDLDRLSFVNVGIEQGQLRIEAAYPSASEPGVLRSIILRGDGTVAYHRCPGYNTHGRCFHVAEPEAIVAEYHIRQYRMATDEQLRADDRWYMTRIDTLDKEGLLQWGACGSVLAERLEAAYGRVATPQEATA